MQACDVIEDHVVQLATKIAEVGVGHVVWHINGDNARADESSVAIKISARLDLLTQVTIAVNTEEFADGNASLVSQRWVRAKGLADRLAQYGANYNGVKSTKSAGEKRLAHLQSQ